MYSNYYPEQLYITFSTTTYSSLSYGFRSVQASLSPFSNDNTPVTLDCAHLARNDLVEDGSTHWAHAGFANRDVDVFAKVSNGLYGAYDCRRTYTSPVVNFP